MKFNPAVLLGILLPVSLLACQSVSPKDIDTRPSFAVRYATERVSPAVVMLDVLSESFSGGQSSTQRGIGSGIIIDREGHVLTNFHVAGLATRIEATLANQEHVRAKLVGSDHWTDLAVVQLDMDEIHRKNLSFAVATLGTSSDVMLGQPAIAVGTPYGLSRTITAGIISQTDRPLGDSTFNIEGYETGWFNNWLQTDAAINPGNSGGPLINLRGEVIGINTRSVSEGNNLGFAIPIDTAKEVAAKILANKKVTRSYIGVTLQPMQDLEGFFDVAGNTGVLVSYVETDSPAAKAGVQTADVLLAVNGKPVSARFPEQLAAVRKLIADIPVGDKVDLTLRRNGMKVTATTGPATAPAVAGSRFESFNIEVATAKLESTKTPEKALEAWGITVSDITRAYLRTARLSAVQGVLVTSLRTGSPAERANMLRGDIIQRVDDKEVTSTEELETAIEQWQKDHKEVLVDVSRNRGQISLVIKP